MVAIWLAALILGSVFAVAGAPGVARKLLNASIILGCMGLGLGIGYAAGLGGTNFGRAPHEAFPFAIIFGVVAAVACVALNRSRSDS
jgi:hypothetical protein